MLLLPQQVKQQIVVYIFLPVTVFANNGIFFILSVYFVCVRGDMITKYTTFCLGMEEYQEYTLCHHVVYAATLWLMLKLPCL